MPQDLDDGESIEVQGSGSSVYTIKNTGGVFSCTCPAWAFQGAPIEKRTCKHIRRLRGEDAEKERLGGELTPAKKKKSGSSSKADAPPLLLAHKWENDVDLEGWWMSEKLDGVRAYWNGETFLSRLGNEFKAPSWFTEPLGPDPLDGELWVGRGEFQRTVSIVRRHDKSDLWKEVKYLVFDAPHLKDPFEERMEHVRERLEEMEYARFLEHEECEGLDHLKTELARVEGLGGEGLMLRKPKSKYIAGRSSSLLKVKTFHDSEAVVIDYVPGKGKHKGRTGALIVELEDGTRFNVGTGMSDKERENPPDVGSVITFRYQELTKAGVPRFPSFVGERVDVKISVPSFSGKKGKGKTTARASGAPKKPTRAAKAKKRGDVRTFEHEDDDSTSSWEIEVRGSKVTIQHVQRFGDDEASKAAAEKLIAAMVKAGYVEHKPKKAPKKATKKAPKKATKKAPKKAKDAEADASVRYFEFVSEKSNKFWEITQNGTEHTVRFGRIGAKGTTKTKSFDSETAMRASAGKLIQQKLGKGYEEQTAD